MPRVVVTDYTFPDVAYERAAAEAAGGTFAAYQCRTADEVTKALRGAVFGAAQFAPVTREAIAGMAKGAALVRYGIGFDNIDVAAAQELGVPVGYVPDYCTDEVADHTCASLLAMLRRLPQLDASVRAGQWEAVKVAGPIRAFDEILVGLFGFGQIARRVHRKLSSLGFRFAVADPALTEAEAAELGLEKLDSAALFAKCDAICLHAPATADTRGFVNAALLATMKPDAIIINAARGALIDEAALAQALHAGQIGGAALDVFVEEPLAAESPLRSAPNLLLSPHAAWYSRNAITRLQELMAGDITAHLLGRPLRRPIPV